MYIRLVFTKNSEKEIKNLVKEIEEDKLFISQLNEKAGLGCHNFHITLVGLLKKKHINIINNIYNNIYEKKFYVYPLYLSVTRDGYVKINIQYNYKIIKLINNIIWYIPEGNAYFKNTHITIGRYFGKNIKEFEKYINYNINYNINIEVDKLELDESSQLLTLELF